ncbi:23S rRNA (guanosine(2251)-2'-O)-methyltransferase RlmB [Paramicrobacterium agarici]|uniref:23S rRNA (Guanosine2251-2'-O)-methyltransferase n=1 Tax=Paramicrobacterium agarici TaxID=630514 RepID=A0A2A9DVS2_9MICO|nr:23S rRNA (guanosine(2251)-2'-O)-methyltransferase RlmB [Microbacterium agarici]PFG30788.1 23S rRNA (guanosine2251-2'-O)-methyltransferase [Microbacterium agarici]
MASKGRPGASKGKKGPTKGSGGLGRKALEGRGPTPKAEDRTYHPAGKRKAARERLENARGGRAPQGRQQRPQPKRAASDDVETVTGRNSVLEALRTRIPATTLYIATRIEMDDRVKEILSIATGKGIPVLEVTRPELDRMGGYDSVHQGVAITVPAYSYAHPGELFDRAVASSSQPLLVALDGITDPRNLGAIIRSAAAFGSHGVIIPQRRSAGVTAAAWKTSAGAAARLPVARAANLTQALKDMKKQGAFVVGLDGDGDMNLHAFDLADRPLVVVVGSEGKGLSRLVAETCDAIVSIPISAATESLNAGIAASVTLYEIAKRRGEETR